MKKTAFLTLEKAREITAQIPTPFHLYDEAGIRANARSKEVGACGCFGVAVTMHIGCEHNVTAPCQFNGIEVLHLLVVVPALNGNDGRSRVLLCCGSGPVQLNAYFIARFVNYSQFRDLNFAHVCLNA